MAAEDTEGIGDVRDATQDVAQLVVDYVKQETLGPLRGLGRFLVFGIVGSLALCIGLILLLVGLLRLLQAETGSTFAGHLTWVPYVIVAAVGLFVIGLAIWRIGKGQAERRLPQGRK